MGLIAARPEDPEEWAGIPSEPAEQDARVDQLDDVPLPSTDVLGLFGGATVGSIVIPVAVPDDVPQESDSAPKDDGPSQA